jgi:hypothetical protein
VTVVTLLSWTYCAWQMTSVKRWACKSATAEHGHMYVARLFSSLTGPALTCPAWIFQQSLPCLMLLIGGAIAPLQIESLARASQTFTRTEGPPVCNQLFLSDPVMLLPENNYMLSLSVRGSESYCCEECMDTVVAGGVTVSFQCWESSNGESRPKQGCCSLCH